MEDELDTSWINELENIEKDNDIFYKEPINFITVCFLYIHNKDLKKINSSKVIKDSEEGNELFFINKRFSNELLRKTVYREAPLVKLPEKFIKAFKAKMMEVEGHFLENIEMYLRRRQGKITLL